MILKSLDAFVELAKQKPRKKIAVAAAEDDNVLGAVLTAYQQGIIDPVFVGEKNTIIKLCSELNFNIDGINIIDESNPAVSARKAVKLVKDGQAQILMKGLVSTADFLRAVLDKENGLRKGELLSHIGFFELSAYHKLIALTDAAQNISPTFDDKISILKNSVDFFNKLGYEKPKVGIVCAVETVNTKMEATVHAGMMTMMNKRGQIKNCIIDGPLGFDNIVSKEAAEHKGIVSDVAGDADLILAPNIEVANSLYKSFTYFAQAVVAAIILGASVPIVLTSRADSERSKLMSIALAASS